MPVADYCSSDRTTRAFVEKSTESAVIRGRLRYVPLLGRRRSKLERQNGKLRQVVIIFCGERYFVWTRLQHARNEVRLHDFGDSYTCSRQYPLTTRRHARRNRLASKFRTPPPRTPNQKRLLWLLSACRKIISARKRLGSGPAAVHKTSPTVANPTALRSSPCRFTPEIPPAPRNFLGGPELVWRPESGLCGRVDLFGPAAISPGRPACRPASTREKPESHRTTNPNPGDIAGNSRQFSGIGLFRLMKRCRATPAASITPSRRAVSFSVLRTPECGFPTDCCEAPK